MTINEYMQGLKETEKKFNGITEQMLNSTRVWNNEACKGYTVVALKSAGFNDEQIADILAEMTDAFSDYTVEQAEEKYINFCSM